MPTTAREYVVGRGIGSVEQCRALLTELPQELRSWNSATRRVTFLLRILTGREDVLDECLDPVEIDKASGRVFPLAWLNVTYDPERVSADELRTFEEKHQLRLLGMVSSESRFG